VCSMEWLFSYHRLSGKGVRTVLHSVVGNILRFLTAGCNYIKGISFVGLFVMGAGCFTHDRGMLVCV
jgi:hypothetical protein